MLGLLPQVSFSGPVDTVVTDSLVEEVLAVLREALTNVGKHAHASQVVITVAAGEELRLVVADDGDGLGDGNAAGLGLKNLRQRAERLGGDVELGRSREGGTRLTWHVPLVPAESGAAPRSELLLCRTCRKAQRAHSSESHHRLNFGKGRLLPGRPIDHRL